MWYHQEDTVWLTQTQMTELFDTSKQNVSLHINNCFKEGELDKDSVVKDFLTTASDGKKYKTKYYNLMIAESDPKEKDIMTTMVMNLLNVG